MGEPGGLPPDGATYQDAFVRIESAVEAGQTDLSGLGFWQLLRRVKVEPMLAEHWADQAGRIDRKAFEARVRFRFPVWFGNLVLLIGVLFGAAAIVYGMRCDNPTVAGLSFVVAGGAWSVCVHDLAHWAVGRLAGISFLAYYIGGSFPPWPGLKIDYASYLRTSPGARAWMHASGALATKIAPFVALGFCLAADGPTWAAWVLAGIGAFQIATDILFSRKSSDWKRVARERALARVQAARRR
ncbi:MAG TPA: hypothetical protein VEN95_05545 [Actinomycetota bacterium]|jgi:hypothetical protein|nr:hypothetical protein [Actinomycetota bacterium]